jgi:V/A-type H+/Na+-transporting ATPase subunit C
MNNLRLGFYPYTYVRVTVMKSELYKKQQWLTFLKMGVNELLRTLQDGAYKKEMSELADKRDTTALELALQKNMMRTFAKLKRISDEKLQRVLSMYMQRYDMYNIKTIIRAKAAGISNEEITAFMSPSINHQPGFFNMLIQKESINEIVNALPYEIKEKSKIKGETHADLFAIENKLDKFHLSQLTELSKKLKGQGKALAAFLAAEMDNTNIKIILRLLHEGMDKKKIKQYLIQPRQEIETLLDEEDILGIVKKLQKLRLIEKQDHKNEAEMLAHLEIDLDTALLKKESLLMHQHPLTVNVILGFMFAKEIEVKNLKTLLKGKQFGIDTALLERMVIAV